jgi:hypothetical protein
VKVRESLRTGSLVATSLAGSWRTTDVPELTLTESEFDTVTPLLYESGAAALGWHRVSKSSLRDTASAAVLHHAYRLQSLQSDIHEQKIEKVFRLLRHAGVEGVLAKGWATAGLYSMRALRPFGDIDICVTPENFSAARDLFRAPEAEDCWVDLHQDFSEIGNRKVEQLFERARAVKLGAEQVQILGLEDQLALSAIHLLKHGAWRPLWLCDIAVIVESLPEGFNWETCLGADKTRAKWIMCAIGLARELLEADLAKVPSFAKSEVPRWLIENVLKQWAKPFAGNQPPMSHPIPMADLLKNPARLPEGLRQRWPNPILATISVNGDFNNFPRLPYQLANCVTRIGRLLIGSADSAADH